MELFEKACAEIEKGAAERERALKALLKAVAKVKKAAATGEVVALRRAEDEEAAAAKNWKDHAGPPRRRRSISRNCSTRATKASWSGQRKRRAFVSTASTVI